MTVSKKHFVFLQRRLKTPWGVVDLYWLQLRGDLWQLPVSARAPPPRADLRCLYDSSRYACWLQSSTLQPDLQPYTDQAQLLQQGSWLLARELLEPRSGPWGFTIERASQEAARAAGLRTGCWHMLYHGTHAAAADSIMRSGMLQESSGMMGTGVYLGNFWKSLRYAVWTGDYKLRPAAHWRIVRTLVYMPSCVQAGEYRRGSLCVCQRCAASTDMEPKRWVDHAGIWREFASAVYVPAKPIGMRRDGKQRMLVRNPEWAVKSCNVLPLQCAGLDSSTITTARHLPYDWRARIARGRRISSPAT